MSHTASQPHAVGCRSLGGDAIDRAVGATRMQRFRQIPPETVCLLPSCRSTQQGARIRPSARALVVACADYPERDDLTSTTSYVSGKTSVRVLPKRAQSVQTPANRLILYSPTQ